MDASSEMLGHYDYIVVGSGSAGGVLANRLASSQQHRILLLEAGPKDVNPMIHMPGGTAEVVKNKRLNWAMDSEPQRHLDHRRLAQPRGKMLGGSSNINGMVAIRGNAACYDHWAALGNQGWGYRELLPHFKSIETWCNGQPSEFHGDRGECRINPTTFDNPLLERFVQAGRELGLPANDDFNGRCQEGSGRYHANVHRGQRQGTSKAFIAPLRGRSNVRIETGVLVEKVLLEGGKAVGIQATRKGRALHFRANKEVILCAGAFNTPQLLMLSGIGNRAKLEPLGIALQHHLPGVGENLQDHLSLLMNYPCSEPYSMNGIANSAWAKLKVAADYFIRKRGPASHNMVEVGAFCHSMAGLPAPDIQLHLMPTLMYNLTDTPPDQHGVSVRACNLTPLSRGVVELHSADPQQQPKIDFRFLSDPRDLPVLLTAFRTVERLMQAKAWGGIIGPETKGGSDCHNDDAIHAFIRAYVGTDYHPVGTCKMGQDEMAVVDNQLKVHGIDGLRVADASIMPTIVRGNTNLPCMMIGDKCAQLILAQT
ncbi:GMC family oxidoreductase [Ferrimonas pelagia]|uniref:Choline dehydrogenase n=1 Tax=Ferrimonas pelagia TaxID=1177826 RepID=A0ABP9F670_9GAMM